MQVWRHGVPHAAGLQHGQAQQQLRGLAGGRHDVLVDGAFVAGFQRAAFQRHRVGNGQLLGLEARVRRRGSQVELGRVGGVAGGEADVGAAHGHVQAVLRPERVCRAVHGDGAFSAADIDHAQFAAFQKGLARSRGRLGLARQVDCLRYRRRTTDDEAFVVRVVQLHGVGHEQAADQVAVTQLVIAGAVHHVGVGGVVGLAVHGLAPDVVRREKARQCWEGGDSRRSGNRCHSAMRHRSRRAFRAGWFRYRACVGASIRKPPGVEATSR